MHKDNKAIIIYFFYLFFSFFYLFLVESLSAVTFCSFHAMASSVIYYSIYARQNQTYLFYTSKVL